MAKPMAVFQQEQSDSVNRNVSPSPQISVSSPRTNHNSNFDHGYHNEVPRRVKHVEGHVMAEIFSSELGRFQGYRCVCGKQVSDEEDNKRYKMFMCCQGKTLSNVYLCCNG